MPRPHQHWTGVDEEWCEDPGCRHTGLRTRHAGRCPEDPMARCPRPEARLPSKLRCKIVGVSFTDGYPQNLGQLELATLLPWLQGDAPEPVPVPARLVRDPGNVHDPNAVAVEVEGAGHVGYIEARMAAKLAPAMDGGEAWSAEIVEVLVSEESPDRPGIRAVINRVA